MYKTISVTLIVIIIDIILFILAIYIVAWISKKIDKKSNRSVPLKEEFGHRFRIHKVPLSEFTTPLPHLKREAVAIDHAVGFLGSLGKTTVLWKMSDGSFKTEEYIGTFSLADFGGKTKPELNNKSKKVKNNGKQIR